MADGPWIVKAGKDEYRAESFEVLADWVKGNRVGPKCEIRDPSGKRWKLGDLVARVAASVLITTTPSVEGFRISRYLDIDSVEIVIGSGPFSEFTGDVSDFFGARSTAFEEKLQKAKRLALDKLRISALQKGGNAVVGIDLDYTEFSGNRIGVIANGTIVEISPVCPA